MPHQFDDTGYSTPNDDHVDERVIDAEIALNNMQTSQENDAPIVCDEHVDESSTHKTQTRTIHCTARCTSGCKKCACAKAGLMCTSACKCMGCNNNETNDDDLFSFGYWEQTNHIASEFTTMQERVQVLLREPTKYGPHGSVTAHSNVYDIVMHVLQESKILQHVYKDTNLYYEYIQECLVELRKTNPKASVKDVHKAQEQSKKRKQSTTKQQASKKRKLSNATAESNAESMSCEIEDLDADREIACLKEFVAWKSTRSNTALVETFSLAIIELYLVTVIVMGLIPVQNYTKYWSSDEKSLYHGHYVRNLMRRKEFDDIHQYIHIDPPEFVRLFNSTVKKYWKLFPRIAIDEGMLGFKGKVRFKCFMPGKPEKHGVKYFAICDEKGYFYEVWIYEGSESQRGTTATELILDFFKVIPQDTNINDSSHE